MRLFISFFLAIFICLGIFIVMQKMTSSDEMRQIQKEDIPQLVYLRDVKDTEVNEIKRVKPEKPKVQEIKKIDFQEPKMKMNIKKDIKIQPIITENINLSSTSFLSGAQINVNVGLVDANTLMTINKVYPQYPRRAKLTRKEGFVKLQFQIDANGYVHNPTIVEAVPKDIFDKSALRAIKRWRFKPSKGSKTDSLIDATIIFNYRLSK